MLDQYFRHVAILVCLLIMSGCRESESHDTGKQVSAATDKPANASRGSTIQESTPSENVQNLQEVTPETKPATAEPEIITDLSLIQVYEGMPSPVVGDALYTAETLPRDACGEYWVKDPSGFVSKIAVCNHSNGH